MAKKPRARADAEPPPLPPPTAPRPVPLGSVIGQDRAVGVLMDAMKSRRVHHAWIFHGPEGVGKFTTALAFAAYLLDPTLEAGLSGELQVDPESPTQRLLAAGTHPDLQVVTKELAKFHEDSDIRARKQTNIPVDVLRQFMLGPGYQAASVQTTSIAGRVFIVDEAELLASAAQNALLKFLEEPPERVVIILVTSSEERLLPTIRSRCQRVSFTALPPASMEKWIAAQNVELDADTRRWLTVFAEGSPGTFEAARRGNLYAWWSSIGPMLADAEKGMYRVDLGPTMAKSIEEWAAAYVEEDASRSKEAANKAGVDWMLRVLAAFLRYRLKSASRLAAEGKADVRESYLRALDAVRQAESEVDSNVNVMFVMEKLAAEIAAGFATARAGA